MTYEEIFKRAAELYPNEYKDTDYKKWCTGVDMEVLRNVKKESVSARGIDIKDETLIEEPYSDIYIYYIMAQIALWQRDYTAYGVHKELYEARLGEYKDWHIRTYGGKAHIFKNWI